MSHAHRTGRRRHHGHGARSTFLLGLLVAAIVVGLAGLGLVGWVVATAASAPPLSSLKAKDPGSNSEVLAADGSRLGFIQASELRQPVPGSKLPQNLEDATVAIEDQRFYSHKGVDYEGILRAAVKNVVSHKTVQGGSTLTMQLVRNLYTGERQRAGIAGYQRKIREAKLAEELENEHTKAWILEKYLNSVPYGTIRGQTAIGAQAAARTYFAKPVSELTLREAAMLAGLPQAPSAYSPVLAPQRARARRNEVLAKMAQLGMITAQKAQRTMRKGLGLHISKYFIRRKENFFFDYVKDELIKEYGPATVRLGGLKVRTTINLKWQQRARAAIAARIGGIGPSSAIVSIDPRNGYIRTMASSADYGKSKFNLAAQGHRQPGSTFKVMALMTALRLGVNPETTRYTSRSPTKFDDPKYGPIDVSTYSNASGGNMNLVQATLQSDNSVYIQLALDLGPDKVKQTARMMGIRSVLHGYPAETLGGLERGVSPLEMADAYATIASGGYRNRPTAITKVTFPDGHSELPRRWRPKRTQVFSDGVTAEATKILEQNIQSGTGTAANMGCPAAGKTGTTDDYTDAWFVGFTPHMSTAVWVGYPATRVEMRTLYYGGPVAGGTFPALIWNTYMTSVKGSYCGAFTPPTHPFVSKPFYGRYSTSGGNSLQPETDTGTGFGTTTPTTPTAPATPTPGTDDGTTGTGADDGTTGTGTTGGTGATGGTGTTGGGTGGGTGGTGGGTGTGDANGGAVYDPGAYESPRQP
jgi:penicillin-binding protein 1A